ncbi:MAG: hypothetical protein J6Y15_11000 [Bacteroidaceae bacterium]|jgi:hypothetical protein|nr:hypothetical protein [Bacteroidaceae bacterium]MBR6198369.1 hypothetical protein [Bacteroidaceae bacterium]
MSTTTCFSQGQLHILELLKYCKSEGAVEELDSVLSKYYEEKLQTEADRLWDEGVLDGEAIENILSEHLRTPYNAR